MRFADLLRLSLYAAFLILAPGCGKVAMLLKPEPVNAQCSDACFVPCADPLDLQTGTADELLAVSKVNRAELVRCSVRRDACAQCLDRLKQASVIQ